MENLDFKREAEWTVKEIEDYVDTVELSKVLPQLNSCAYLNIRTKEKMEFCVRLSSDGYKVVGNKFNEIDISSSNLIFETVFSLMNHLSPNYQTNFSEKLSERLQKLIEEDG